MEFFDVVDDDGVEVPYRGIVTCVLFAKYDEVLLSTGNTPFLW